MDNTGEVGENSTPQRSYAVKLAIDVHTRLMDSCSNEVRNIPNLHDVLEAHFTRLPLSYALDMNVDRAEDVLIHHMLLEQAAIHASRPAFYIRFLERLYTKSDGNEGLPLTSVNSELSLSRKQQKVAAPSSKRTKDGATEFEPYSKLEDLNLDVLKNTEDVTKRTSDETPKRTKDGAAEFERCSKLEDLNLDVLKHTEDVTERRPSGERPKRRVPEPSSILTHEVIFSTVDKPKLLSQLSTLLSDIGLNIREAHVFSTIDGYSLDVFVVDGCNEEDTAILEETMKNAIANSEHRYSHSQSVIEKALGSKCFDWEIDLRLLKREEKIGSGFGGDLYRGTYKGQDVAIKELNRKLINEDPMSEFAQELKILRETRHRNVVSFFGACTKFPLLCILTEYMSGGNLYAYLQSRNETLKLSQLLKFAIDICKGMEYLHSNNIIHRDLKTPNLLLSSENVVKVCDFGISRFQNRDGVMTAERGTYRWMAPEVMKHLPYDEKADVFSFAIVLWELVTGKLPYRSMTPLQAAMTLVQGMRLEIPENTHPKLTELIERCWEDDPTKRPAFSSIAIELECLLQEVEQTSEVEEGAVEIL